MKFNQAYSNLINQLPPSIVENTWERLTTRKRNPLTESEATNINPIIENFLQHKINVYNRKKKRQRRITTPLENLSQLYKMENKNTQTEVTNNKICMCNHEEEINRRVDEKVDILWQQLLKSNKETIRKFTDNILKDYEERINSNNKKLQDEMSMVLGMALSSAILYGSLWISNPELPNVFGMYRIIGIGAVSEIAGQILADML